MTVTTTPVTAAIRPANADDLRGVEALLVASGLPTAGVAGVAGDAASGR